MNKNRESLMRDVQISQFALVEANLYLDTHPDDCEAMKAIIDYSEKFSCAVEKYQENCGPLFADSSDSVPFEWVTSPFPWETEDK